MAANPALMTQLRRWFVIRGRVEPRYLLKPDLDERTRHRSCTAAAQIPSLLQTSPRTWSLMMVIPPE